MMKFPEEGPWLLVPIIFLSLIAIVAFWGYVTWIQECCQ